MNNTALQLPNAYGELPLDNAPVARLANGNAAIPQQFLVYQRTKTNVETIISRIQFCDKFPLFVRQEKNELYLQVGIVGQENYPPNQTLRQPKIVYGRSWKIEPYQPTSEIIQTAFLAIEKAREHELREFLALSYELNGKVHKSTPFNSHMDLPLMAANPELFELHTDGQPLTPHQAVRQMLKRLYLGSYRFVLHEMTALGNDAYISLTTDIANKKHASASDQLANYFPELKEATFSLLLADITDLTVSELQNQFLYALMDKLLFLSKRYIEENFLFDGFARFSRTNHVEAIGQFSLDTRLFDDSQLTPSFKQDFQANSYYVDSQRAPSFASSQPLASIQKHAVETISELDGYYPTPAQ